MSDALPLPTAFGDVVSTADGSLTLSHPRLGECYHSRSGARGEAQRLYVEASGLGAAWAAPGPPVAVLDVGVGLGYNAVATFASWRAAAAPPALAVTSLEVDAALVAALASGAAPWQVGWSDEQRDFCRGLRQTAEGWTTTLRHPRGAAGTWRVVVADAAKAAVPRAATGPYRFVWQDPFSPANNPPLWSSAWFTAVGVACAPGCVLMTYSVARAVRDALAAAGWDWERIPARESTKRQWLLARRPLNTI